jgi:hypothetical protein
VPSYEAVSTLPSGTKKPYVSKTELKLLAAQIVPSNSTANEWMGIIFFCGRKFSVGTFFENILSLLEYLEDSRPPAA